MLGVFILSNRLVQLEKYSFLKQFLSGTQCLEFHPQKSAMIRKPCHTPTTLLNFVCLCIPVSIILSSPQISFFILTCVSATWVFLVMVPQRSTKVSKSPCKLLLYRETYGLTRTFLSAQVDKSFCDSIVHIKMCSRWATGSLKIVSSRPGKRTWECINIGESHWENSIRSYINRLSIDWKLKVSNWVDMPDNFLMCFMCRSLH